MQICDCSIPTFWILARVYIYHQYAQLWVVFTPAIQILTFFISERYHMGWLWLVGSLKLQVSFAKEPYKRDNILQKRPIINY